MPTARGSTGTVPVAGGPKDGRKQMEYVKIGDECSFEGMRGGIMTGDSALCRLGITVEERRAGSSPASSREYDECVFELVPMLSYRARQEYEAKRRKMREQGLARVESGLTPDDAKSTKEEQEHDLKLLKELRLSEQNEARANAQAPIEQRGVVLNYGDVVQLLHKRSNLFVKLLERTAPLDRHCQAVTLGKGGEGCYFILKPRFKTRSMGSPVYVDDEVAIVSLKSSSIYMHGSRSKFYSSPMSTMESKGVVENSDKLGSPLPFTLNTPRQREVNGSRDFFSFRVNLFQRVVDLGELRTQDGFRLFHPEAESFLQASGSVDRQGKRTDGKTWESIPYLKRQTSEKGVLTIIEGRLDPNLNVKGLWSFENRNRTQGSAIGFDTAIRIRHLPSKKYLSCQTSSAGDSDSFDCALVDDVDPEAEHGCFGSPHSLDFYIVPEDIIQASSVPRNVSTLVRIEHAHSRDASRLHFLHTGQAKVPCHGSQKSKAENAGTTIVFSRQEARTDMLKLVPASAEETQLVNGIVATRFLLLSYQWQMENAIRAPVELVESCIPVILALMDNVTKGDGFGSGFESMMAKPVSEYISLANACLPTKFSSFFMGRADVGFQNKVIDCKIMDAIFNMSLAPYKRFLRMDESGRLLPAAPQSLKVCNPWKDQDGHARIRMTKPRALQKFLNVALQLCFNENYRAQIYFSRRKSLFLDLESSNGSSQVNAFEETWLNIIASMSEDPLGATVTLSKLLDNNERIIASVVNVPLLQRFCQLIIKCGPQPRFLRLFESICTSHGAPIIANQEMVVRQIWMNEQVRGEVLISIHTEEGAFLQGGDEVLAGGIPEGIGFLASKSTNRGSQLPAIFITWSEDLYFSPDKLGLNKRPVKNRTDSDKAAVPLEQLCWILDPKELCEKVTGIRWSDIDPSAPGKSGPENKLTAEELKNQEQLADWFVAQLKLLRQVVLGRSYNAIHKIEMVYTYEICLSMAWNDLLPDAVRACALNLLVACHVDRYPQLANGGKASIPEPLWIYDSQLIDQGSSGVAKIRDRALLDSDALPGFYLADDHPFVALKDEAKSFRTDTKFFLLRNLANFNINKVFRLAHSARAKNEFALANLDAAKALLNFGFQSNIHKLRPLGQAVARLLDGRQDEETPGCPFLAPEDRYKDDAGNFLRITQLKVCAIDILMKVSDLRANYRLAKILALWKYSPRFRTLEPGSKSSTAQVVPVIGEPELLDQKNPSEIRQPVPTEGGSSNKEIAEGADGGSTIDPRLSEEIFIEFETLFNPGPDASDAVQLDLAILTGEPIGEILIDCLMYSSDDLFEAAFRLLDRRFGQRRKLLAALKNVYLLDSSEIPIFDTTNKLLGSSTHLLYVLRSTQEWSVSSRLSGEFDKERFEFLCSTCEKLSEFVSTDSKEELKYRQSILNAAAIPAALLAGLNYLDPNLSFKGSICSDRERLESQHMILVALEHVARLMFLFVSSNTLNQETMFPYITRIISRVDTTLQKCSPPDEFEEVHAENHEQLQAVRRSCKEAIVNIIDGNISHCLTLCRPEFQCLFDTFSRDLNADLKDTPSLRFFLSICQPSKMLPPLHQVQECLMKVLLEGDTVKLRQAMRSALTFYSSSAAHDEERLLRILAILMAGNNVSTVSRISELLYLESDDNEAEAQRMDAAASINFFSSGLEHFQSARETQITNAEEGGDGGSGGDGAILISKALPVSLAALSEVSMLIIATLPVDPDLLTSQETWSFCENLCNFFEAYLSNLTNRVLRNITMNGVLIFECFLRHAAQNSLLEVIFQEHFESLKRLMGVCHKLLLVRDGDSRVQKACHALLVCAGETVEIPTEVVTHQGKKKWGNLRGIRRMSLFSSTPASSGRNEANQNRTMAENLAHFQKAVIDNPRIENKIKLRRFGLANELERGLGQPVIVALHDELNQSVSILLYTELEGPFPSAIILCLVVLGAMLAVFGLMGRDTGGVEEFEWVLSIVFIVELAVRMNGFVQKMGDGKWSVVYRKIVNGKAEVVHPFIADPLNVIDIMCVLGDSFMWVILLATESDSKVGSRLIAFLKLFRLARLLKIVRYVMQVLNIQCVNLVETNVKVKEKGSNHSNNFLQAKVSWGDIVSRMVRFGMANYHLPEKNESIIRIFDTLYFSLLKHRTVSWRDTLEVRELDSIPPSIHGFKNQREVFEFYQATMVNNGVSKLLFSTISNSPPTFSTSGSVYSAFRLLMETLQGGNVEVQSGLISCIQEDDPDGKFHQHLSGRMTMTQDLVQSWRYNEDGSKDSISEYREKLARAGDTFEALQLMVEGHNETFQILLSNQATHITPIDLLHHAVLTLLVLCESESAVETMMNEEIQLTQKVFEFLAESCYGPCEHNQIVIATKLDAVIAVRNVLKLSIKFEGDERSLMIIKLKIAAMQLLFACFEGHTDEEEVVPGLKSKLEPSLLSQLEVQLETIARQKMKDIEESRRKRDIDSQDDAQTLYFEVVDGICKIRSIMDKFDRAKSSSEEGLSTNLPFGRTRASHSARTTFNHVRDFSFGESLYGVVEVFWRGRTLHTYFPLPIAGRNLSLEVRENVLSKIDVAVGRRMSDLVLRREDIMKTLEQDADFVARFRLFGWVHRNEANVRMVMYLVVVILNYNTVLWSDQKCRFLVSKTFREPCDDGIKVLSFLCAVDADDGQLLAFVITWIGGLIAFCGYLIIAAIHIFRAVRSTMGRLDSSINNEKMKGEKDEHNRKLTALIGPAVLAAFSFIICLVTYASFGSATYAAVGFGVIIFSWTLQSIRGTMTVPQSNVEYFFMTLYDTVCHGRYVGGHLVLQTLLIIGFLDTNFWTLILFDVFNFNDELQDILRSITGPGRSLLLIAFTVVITLLVFAINGSSAFGIYFNHEDGFGGAADDEAGDGGIEYGGAGCDSPLSCFFYLLYFGLQEGGNLAPIMEGANFDGSGDYFSRMIYDLLFFIWVGVLLFNIITGLILDAFSSQRQRSESRNDIFKNECFVCGISRSQFKDMNLPAGDDNFEQHAFVEHNLWNYIFFIDVLHVKDRLEYTGMDTFVKRCLDTGQLSWAPSQTSCAIEMHGRKRDVEASVWEELKALQSSISSRFEGVTAAMEDLQTQLSAVVGKLASPSVHHAE